MGSHVLNQLVNWKRTRDALSSAGSFDSEVPKVIRRRAFDMAERAAINYQLVK